MKIVGICGSPRKNGNSEWALNYILNECEKFCNVENINIADKNILLCDGCLVCEEDYDCIHKDDMNYINNQLLNSDILIISTPVYFDNVPGVFKNFIDRTNPICNKMKGKKAVVITFGQADEISWNNATQYINTYFDILGISVIGKYSFNARNKFDASNNNEIKNKLSQIILELEQIAKHD